MPRQGVDKIIICQQGDNLLRKEGLNLAICTSHIGNNLQPSVKYSYEILHIPAEHVVAFAAPVKRLQLCRQKIGRTDASQPHAIKRVLAGDSHGIWIPAICESKDLRISRHHVKDN